MIGCYFAAQNGPIAINEIFGKTFITILMYLLPSLIVQNFKKILRVDPEELFQKNHQYNFHVPFDSFHYAKFFLNH